MPRYPLTNPLPVRVRVRLAAGCYVYDLGPVWGTTSDELTSALASLCEAFAAALREDQAAPAAPTEAAL